MYDNDVILPAAGTFGIAGFVFGAHWLIIGAGIVAILSILVLRVLSRRQRATNA